MTPDSAKFEGSWLEDPEGELLIFLAGLSDMTGRKCSLADGAPGEVFAFECKIRYGAIYSGGEKITGRM